MTIKTRNPGGEARAPEINVLGGAIDTGVLYRSGTAFATPSLTRTSTAVAIVAERWRLSPSMARLVCELAQLGGRLA